MMQQIIIVFVVSSLLFMMGMVCLAHAMRTMEKRNDITALLLLMLAALLLNAPVILGLTLAS